MDSHKGFTPIFIVAIIAVMIVGSGVLYYQKQLHGITIKETVNRVNEIPVQSNNKELTAPDKEPIIPKEHTTIKKQQEHVSIVQKEEEKITIKIPTTSPPQPPSSAPRIQTIKSIVIPGYAELIAVANGVAASLSRDDVIQVVDVTNPSAPIKIKTIDTPAFAEAAYQKDDLLYIADSRELRILDSAGKTIGIYPHHFWASALTVDNGYTYLVGGNEMLILDVTNSQNIKKVAKVTLTGTGPTHIVVQNNYAYVIESLGGLNIIDIQNRATPKIIKVLPFESHTIGFRIQGNHAYIGRVSTVTSTAQGYSQTSTFEIVDISNPAAAKVVGSLQIPTNIKGLDLEGNFAYIIGTYPYRLVPIDISSPTNPKLVNVAESIVGSTDLQDVVVEDNYAFLADGSLGLKIVDVSNTANPKHIADLDLKGRAFNVYKSGNKLYLAVEQKYFNVADVQNPQAPQPTFSEAFTASYKYTNIVLHNTKAYFNGGGAKIYDVADVKTPRHIKISPTEVDSIQIQGNYLYSTIGEIGLLVYDISNPSSLVQISKTPFPKGIPRDLSVDGQWAVGISNSPYSINVFDISDPKKPAAKSDYQYQKYPNTVTVKDNHAYVARGESGVDIFTINLNGTLTLIKNIATQGYAHHVTIVDNKALIVRDGADVYDITNPAKPVFLYHISNNENSKGEANRVVIDNGYLYIADGYAGITIVAMPK